MSSGFDFSTEEVLDWELEAVLRAVDEETLRLSRHARQEMGLDGLVYEDVADAIAFYDEVSKDLPGNPLGRAPGLNFDRYLQTVTIRVKVGWNERGYYIAITVMAN